MPLLSVRLLGALGLVDAQDLFLNQNRLEEKTTQGRCLFSEACWPSDDELRQLGGSLDGDLLLSNDGGSWRAAKHLKNKLLDITPGAIVMAESPADVQAAMQYAYGRKLAVSVKSTGSCYNGNCLEEGSFHVDLSRMKTIQVDKDNMVLLAQPGTNFAEIYKLVDKHDVVVVGGMCNGVGPVGYSLGGGHGPLIRSYGLASDNIVSVDLVTPSGDLVHVSDDENSSLMRALRGGGGGAFGIVTSIAMRLHPAPSQMVSVSCTWPMSQSSQRVGESTIADWHSRVMPALPNEWQTYTVGMKSPLGPKAPGWNPFTMDGLFNVEGLYNGVWSDEMLKSIDDLLNLGKDHQLGCELKNFSSFNSWHAQAWFASEGPIDFRVKMASSFASPNFDSQAHAKLMVDSVLALPSVAINMMFGVQLGGKILAPDVENSISPDFRNGLFFQENDADWNFAWADKEQMSWASTVGDAFAALDGFSGTYLNEMDPIGRGERGTYENNVWGSEIFAKLQAEKKKWDAAGLFDGVQSVHN